MGLCRPSGDADKIWVVDAVGRKRLILGTLSSLRIGGRRHLQRGLGPGKDFAVGRDELDPALALAAWCAGTVASLSFVNYGNLFSNLGSAPAFFNTDLIGALHGADVSGLVSAAVAAAVYWGGRRLRPS